MDSKLKRLCIVSALAVISIAVFLVVIVNQEKPSSVNASLVMPSEAVEESKDSNQIGDDLSAFLDDPTFFDVDPDSFMGLVQDDSNRLSLMVTSIEKDLRIQIVGQDGSPVTGKSFFVAVEELGEYKDLDKDGVIYIGDIASGDYHVSLNPMVGYKVPTNSTKIHVKDKVEYVPIDDISLLIKTEEEIDAELEDTSVKNAIEDADRTEVKRLQAGSKNTQVGIDVSKWQGEIDWEKAAKAGVQFAIIRAGYRGSSTGALVVDPYFEANIKGAIDAGVDVGVYFFTQAVNEIEAVEEASMVLQLVEEYPLNYPIYIDTEGAGGNGRADGLDVDTRTLVCDAFCRTVENSGYNAGVYASRNWLNNNLHTEKLEQYSIWLAEYRSVPKYDGYYEMWQYTSNGRVDGIEGRVDLNISYVKE